MTTERPDDPGAGLLPAEPLREGTVEYLPEMVGRTVARGTRLHLNVAQDLHVISRDRIKMALMETLPSYIDGGLVVGRIGVFLALALALVTTDTKEIFGVSASTWGGLLLFLTGMAFLWTAAGVVKYLRRAKIDDIVEKILEGATDEHGNPRAPQTSTQRRFWQRWFSRS